MGNNVIKIIGDCHFGDKNIIKLEDRQFKNVNSMDKFMIKSWNEEVEESDTVIVNGDFSIYDLEKTAEIVSSLKGKKILIRGNHDKLSNADYIKCGFEYVYDYPIILDDFWIVSHKPMYVNIGGAYANIFADVHNNPNYRDISSRGFCTSAERKYIRYRPIKFDNIKSLVTNKL